jgi:hypothetical protein
MTKPHSRLPSYLDIRFVCTPGMRVVDMVLTAYYDTGPAPTPAMVVILTSILLDGEPGGER